MKYIFYFESCQTIFSTARSLTPENVYVNDELWLWREAPHLCNMQLHLVYFGDSIH